MRYDIQKVEEINSIDLNDELEKFEKCELALVTSCNEEGYLSSGEKIEVLFIKEIGRAGISWGAQADWTCASSVEDAVERFLSVGEKVMCD
jgi:hypothetical protein